MIKGIDVMVHLGTDDCFTINDNPFTCSSFLVTKITKDEKQGVGIRKGNKLGNAFPLHISVAFFGQRFHLVDKGLKILETNKNK